MCDSDTPFQLQRYAPGKAITGGMLLLMLLLMLTAASTFAQQPQSGEEELIKPSRPDVADPAEFQPPGVLQVEYGFDSTFRAEDFRDQQRTPLTLRFAATRRLLLESDFDAVISERDEETRERQTGVGDVRLGAQVLVVGEGEGRPALAFAYFVKLPSASDAKRLGSGRVDHRVVALVSKKLGDTDVDFNVAYLNVGREGSNRRSSGAQAALSFTRELTRRFGIDCEISGQSEEDLLPRGLYPLGSFFIKVNDRVQFDAGVRFGIGAQAPRLGVFTGIVVGIGKRQS